MKSLSVFTLAVLGALATAIAAAQYRDGQPPVIAPPAAPDAQNHDTQVMNAFQKRYLEAKTPAIALFWNQELTDRTAQRTQNRTSTQQSKNEFGSASSGSAATPTEKHEDSATTTVTTQETIGDSPRETLDVRSDALLKSAFVSNLRATGVRLVDRTLMIRSNAAQQPQAVDTQLNEAQGLEKRAQLLMQILFVKDPNTPLGYGFKVTVTDVTSAVLLTEFYTQALPAAREQTVYVAVNGGQGFERATQPVPTVRGIGNALAIEVMSQLGAVL